MSEHPCQSCGTPSRLDERFCPRCGLLFPALPPIEPVTQAIRRTPAPSPPPIAPRPRAHPPPQGRRHGPLVAVVAVLAAIASAVFLPSLFLESSPTTEEQVRWVFGGQVAAIRTGRFEDAHARFSPDVRRSCPIDAWVAGFGPFLDGGGDLSLLDHAGVEVRVAGDDAFVTYDLLYDGRVLEEVSDLDPDRYARIDGRWYDAADPFTACGAGGEAVPSPA
jgi:hypothetical protein